MKASVPTPGRFHRLEMETTEPIQFVDLTDEVAALVRASAVAQGIVTVFSRHTTASICIQEDEPLLLEDLRMFLQRSAPEHAPYRHNDFRLRTVHVDSDERPNGHAHCQQLFLGASETIPLLEGEMQLGTWQRIFLIELDGPRARREVLVQVVGPVES